ncbi:MAG: hypothetical protein ACRCZF_20545 [Gemmataceae bacterium]
MNDEAKLGMVAGVLAVIGVALFGLSKEPLGASANAATANTPVVAGTVPAAPPAAIAVPR